MKLKLFRQSVLLLLMVLLIGNLPVLPNQPRANNHPNTKSDHQQIPKLAVLLVLDQFRADYLQRFWPLFGERGFRRLIARSAYFTDANYLYSNTYTAVGHATIVTGSIPSIHGVIGNQWYDREAGQIKGAVADSQVTGTGTVGRSSPWRLLSTTLGDQLRLSNNYHSKSIGISIKDRAASFIAGRHASAAYWFDHDTGAMVSSSYYLATLPDWVVQFNQQHFADHYFGQQWDRKLPVSAYQISDIDDAQYEDTWPGNSKTFPHLLNGDQKEIGPNFFNQFTATPFSNELLVKFAAAAIQAEKLGQGEYPDWLAISFSATDLVGHLFGPYSQEEEDIVLRLDDTLGDLLDLLDQQFGLENLLIAVTADHGVAPIPEYSQTHGLGGGRIIGAELHKRLESALNARYGKGEFILSLINHEIYLNEKLINEKHLSIAEVEDFVGREALKTAGIANYFTRTRILAGEVASTDVGRRVMAGFNAQRSGNLLLMVEPFVLIAEFPEENYGTAHGTPYHYDTHVPILLSGPGIKPGRYLQPCSPSDIAPTISTILQIEPPSGSVGRVLIEALEN